MPATFVRLENRFSELVRLNKELDAFASAEALPTAMVNKMKIVLEETVMNILSYAFETDARETDEITVALANIDQLVTVTIRDTGKPFDPLKHGRGPLEASIEDTEIGGLGIHLTKNLSDAICYERKDRRNILTITLKP